jgi:hypothetical protein
MPKITAGVVFRCYRRGRMSGLRLAGLILSGGLLLATAACGPDVDPLTRQGLFQPDHTNRNNLVLQAANPADLVRGTGVTGADGQLAAAAVERLRADRVKRLPASDIAQVAAGNSGDNNSSGGAGGGGGQ